MRWESCESYSGTPRASTSSQLPSGLIASRADPDPVAEPVPIPRASAAARTEPNTATRVDLLFTTRFLPGLAHIQSLFLKIRNKVKMAPIIRTPEATTPQTCPFPGNGTFIPK